MAYIFLINLKKRPEQWASEQTFGVIARTCIKNRQHRSIFISKHGGKHSLDKIWILLKYFFEYFSLSKKARLSNISGLEFTLKVPLKRIFFFVFLLFRTYETPLQKRFWPKKIFCYVFCASKCCVFHLERRMLKRSKGHVKVL